MKKDNITLGDVYELLQEFRNEMRECYVQKIEFEPVKKIVYGSVTLVLTAVVGAVIALVIIIK